MSEPELAEITAHNIKIMSEISEKLSGTAKPKDLSATYRLDMKTTKNSQEVTISFVYEEVEKVSVINSTFDILAKLFTALFITILIEIAIVSWKNNDEGYENDLESGLRNEKTRLILLEEITTTQRSKEEAPPSYL